MNSYYTKETLQKLKGTFEIAFNNFHPISFEYCPDCISSYIVNISPFNKVSSLSWSGGKSSDFLFSFLKNGCSFHFNSKNIPFDVSYLAEKLNLQEGDAKIACELINYLFEKEK